MKFTRFIQIVILFITQALLATPNVKTLSERVQISVITCDVGDELYALYGHTAIRVSDPINGIDRVYNYGLFDFNTANFYTKFVKGDLLYLVDYNSFTRFLQAYAYDDRSVYEQVLNLSYAQKQEIWRLLNQAVQPENREYIYRFVEQNCTTKVADLINQVIQTPLKVQVQGNEGSYRSAYSAYQKNNYFINLGINLAFGSKMDHRPEKLSLPLNLMRGLSESTLGAEPLVSKTYTHYESQAISHTPWWNSIWFFSLILLVVLFCSRNTVVSNVFFIIIGLLGVFFIVLDNYTLHEELNNNNAVFLFNPLFILIPFWRSVKNTPKLNLLISLLLMSLVAFVGLNINSEKLILTLPILFVLILSLLVLKNAKKVND